MSSLSQYDLRVINKFIQKAKQAYAIQLEYQDPLLGQKICELVSEKDDPELTVLWNTLSVGYRANSVPVKQKHQKTPKKSGLLYRGKSAKNKESTLATEDSVKSAVAEGQKAEDQKAEDSGHYITYRGKKRWVSKSN